MNWHKKIEHNLKPVLGHMSLQWYTLDTVFFPIQIILKLVVKKQRQFPNPGHKGVYRIPEAVLTSSLYFDLWITTALEGTVDSGFRMLNSGFGRFRCWRFFHSSNVISWTTSSIGSPSAALEVYHFKVKTISLQHSKINKNTSPKEGY